MPLKEADLKDTDTYKKASRMDLPKVAAGNVKFWIYKDIELPNPAGKKQKYPAFLAFVDDSAVRKAFAGKKMVCKGICGIKEERIAFEPSTGKVPYKVLKTSVPLLLGKAVWIPTGMEEDSGEGENDDAVTAGPVADGAIPAPPPTPPAQASAAPPPAAPPPPPAVALAASWGKLVKDAQAYAAAHPDRKEALFREMAAIADLLKANKSAEAKPKMDHVQGILDAPPTAPPSAPGQSSEDPKVRAAALMAEWNQLKPAMTQAAADPARRAKIEALAAQFKQEFQGGKLDGAQKTLAGLAELSKAPPKTTSAGAGGEQEFQRAWSGAKQIWIACMEKIDGQINQVAGKMRASSDPDFKRIADLGLPALTENHKTPVMRALFALDGPAGPERLAAAAKAKAAIGAFRSHVASSKQMKTLDEHSQTAFGVALTLRSEINKGLAALDQALGALQA